MLRVLATLAIERQCTRFGWTVLNWNTPAVDFYAKLGATVLPQWRVVRVTGEARHRLTGLQALPDDSSI
ncbi:hypothetical protein B0O95_101225 [Mycetohabitans endofungorum]|uniref:Acetyltransferase (GNAT) family protein n=1 Tax=Mycetohabitans endofungorum TaxID=417203 RepID=A0A2P5KEK9_9BURK|nr:hypothetical protein B0O95_101225 [Mycetohabitans endofungorum]